MSNNKKKIHWSHPEHALEMIDRKKRYECNGCKMDGVGKRYTCSEQKDYSLHPCCMAAGKTSKITIEGQTYSFFDSPRPAGKRKKAGSRSCDACGMIVSGFVYHCPETDEDFHPACFKLLDSKLDIPDAKFLLKKEEVVSKCALCKRKVPEGAVKKIPGWSYIVEDEELNFHVYCIMELAMDTHRSSSTSNKDLSSKLKGTEVLPKTKTEKISKTESVVKPESSLSSKNNKDLSPALKGTKVLPESKSKSISKTKLVKVSDSSPSKSKKDVSLPSKGTKVLPETKDKKVSKTKTEVKSESSSSKNNKDSSPALKETKVIPESKSKKIPKTKLVKESDSSSSKSNKDSSLPSKGTEVQPTTKSKKTSETKKSVVKDQSSSSKSNKDLPSTSKGTNKVVVKNKSNEISKTKPKKSYETKKWLIPILKFFISATVSILMGDPTTLIATPLVHVIFEGLFNASG